MDGRKDDVMEGGKSEQGSGCQNGPLTVQQLDRDKNRRIHGVTLNSKMDI